MAAAVAYNVAWRDDLSWRGAARAANVMKKRGVKNGVT